MARRSEADWYTGSRGGDEFKEFRPSHNVFRIFLLTLFVNTYKTNLKGTGDVHFYCDYFHKTLASHFANIFGWRFGNRLFGIHCYAEEEFMTVTTPNSTGRPAESMQDSPDAKRPPPGPPPPWALEKFCTWLGRLPAAVGKWLDRLAGLKNPIGTVVRFFSSVWLGLLWLFLTAAYIAVGSGMPWVRSAFDVTSMEFFDAWPMVVLMVLLILTLTVVTFRRIPFTLYRLGVWTVHSGIITLVIGCFFYFGMKHEGMVRIFLHQKVDHYYDSTERALYIVNPENGRHVMMPMPKLPIFIKRAPGHDPLNYPISKSRLAKLNPAWSNAKVTVVGYYPYSQLEPYPFPRRGRGQPHNPAVAVNLNSGGVSSGAEWLVGNNPTARVTDSRAPFGIEYLYHPSARRQRDISTSFHGNNAIIVNIPKYHVRRVYVIQPNTPIKVKGTPYTLTPLAELSMPLRSRRYLGAVSPCYMINVDRKGANGDFHFQRAALFRYPTRTVDFIFQHGKRVLVPQKIDHNLHIRYLDARTEQFWIVEHKNGAFTLVHRAAGGKVTVQPIAVGGRIPVNIRGIPAEFVLQQTADLKFRPHLIPRSDRQPKVENIMGKCVLQLHIARPDRPVKSLYLQFQQFGLAGDLPPGKAALTHGEQAKFVFSQLQRPLPVSLKLIQCKELFYSGGDQFPRDFISKVKMSNLKTGRTWTAIIHLNHPAQADGLHLFQARFGRDPQTGHPFTVLGVGNTHGFYAMLTGVVMVIFGIGYAFYVKPVLLNIKKKQLADYAAGLQKTAA